MDELYQHSAANALQTGLVDDPFQSPSVPASFHYVGTTLFPV